MDLSIQKTFNINHLRVGDIIFFKNRYCEVVTIDTLRSGKHGIQKWIVFYCFVDIADEHAVTMVHIFKTSDTFIRCG